MKQFIIFLFLLLIMPAYTQAAAEEKVVFTREGNIWVKTGKTETKLSQGGKATFPEWSQDGEYVAYYEGNKLVASEVKSGKTKQVAPDTLSFQWSPIDNKLAYIENNMLSVYDVKTNKTIRVALGVDQFSWFPSGDQFLLTANASLNPDGWGAVRLYTVGLHANLNPKAVQPFFTLPAMSEDFFAYTTSSFKFSSSGQWISFLAIPTASAAADSNTLCVITKEGNAFQIIGKMLNDKNWFKWSPAENELAFIDGEGRFATENKKFKLKEMPAFMHREWTPKGFADWDFTWHNDKLVTISRIKETPWSNEEAKRPLPLLYQMELQAKEQKQISLPPDGYGDYAPQFVHRTNHLIWIRSNRRQADVMMGRENGKGAKVYIQNIDVPVGYYELYDWNKVLSVYNPSKKTA